MKKYILLMNGQPNIVNMSIFSKVIYKFIAIPI